MIENKLNEENFLNNIYKTYKDQMNMVYAML